MDHERTNTATTPSLPLFATHDLCDTVCSFLKRSELLTVFCVSKNFAHHVATLLLDVFMEDAELLTLQLLDDNDDKDIMNDDHHQQNDPSGTSSFFPHSSMLIMPHPDVSRFKNETPTLPRRKALRVFCLDHVPVRVGQPPWVVISTNVTFLFRWSRHYPTLESLITAYCNIHTHAVLVPHALCQLNSITVRSDSDFVAQVKKKNKKTITKRQRSGPSKQTAQNDENSERATCDKDDDVDSDGDGAPSDMPFVISTPAATTLHRVKFCQHGTHVRLLANFYAVYDTVGGRMDCLQLVIINQLAKRMQQEEDVDKAESSPFRSLSRNAYNTFVQRHVPSEAEIASKHSDSIITRAALLASFLATDHTVLFTDTTFFHRYAHVVLNEHFHEPDEDIEDSSLEVRWDTISNVTEATDTDAKDASKKKSLERVLTNIVFRLHQSHCSNEIKTASDSHSRPEEDYLSCTESFSSSSAEEKEMTSEAEADELDPRSYNRGRSFKTEDIPERSATSFSHIALNRPSRARIVRIDFSSSTWAKETVVLPDKFLYGCSSLRHLSLHGFTSVVTIGNLFVGACKELSYLDLTPLVSLVVVGHAFGKSCDELRGVVFPTRCRVRVIGDMFLSQSRNIKRFDFKCFPYLERIGIELFEGGMGLETIDFTGIGARNRVSRAMQLNNQTMSHESGGGGAIVSVDQGFLCGCFSLRNVIGLERIGLPVRRLLNASRIEVLDTSTWSIEGKDVPRAFLTDCHQLTSVNLHGLRNLTMIRDSFLSHAEKLSGRLDLSPFRNVRCIGNCFLEGCKSITALDFSPLRALEIIDNRFCAGCSSLTSINLNCPNLRRIGNEFLDSCSALQELDMNGMVSLQSIATRFCWRCMNLERVYCDQIPRSKETTTTGEKQEVQRQITIGSAAFDWCDKLSARLSRLGWLSKHVSLL